MVYKLDDADKLCGVTYIDWSKKYSKIPKATCEMIQPKCSSGGGSSNDDAVELSCEDIKKLIHGEDKPKENKPNEDNAEVNLLELMPKIEDSFSVVTHKDGMVTSVTGNSQEQKDAFERKIIETLKGKLPEGAVVEAVIGEPFYKEGSELITGKTNYTINVRVTLNGKVYEHEYSVPTIEEEQSKSNNNVTDEEVKEIVGNHEFNYGYITPTNDGKIGSLVGNNMKPITSEELEKQSEVFSDELKAVLGDRVKNVSVDLVQLLNAGDYIGENITNVNSVFRVDITLKKANGSNVKLSEHVTTTVFETL